MNHRITEVNDYLDLLIMSNTRQAKNADEKRNRTLCAVFNDRVMMLEVIKKDINYILRGEQID